MNAAPRSFAQNKTSALKSFLFESPGGILLILCVSLVLKFGVRLFLAREIDFWQSGYSFYHQMAVDFLQKGALFIQNNHSLYQADKLYALRTPLYPLWIAAIGKFTHFSVPAFIFLQALLSTLTVAIVYQITSQLGGPKAAFFGAFFYAFYPYAFFHDTQLQENVLYNFFSMLSIWILLAAIGKKKNDFIFLCGISLGAAALTRASHFIHAMVLIFLMLYLLGQNRKQAVRPVLLVLVGFFLVLAPWLIRNKRVLGAPVLTSLTGGTLSEAHNPHTFRYYPYRGSIDQSTGFFRAELLQNKKEMLESIPPDEMGQNRYYQKLALEYVAWHKMETFRRGLVKIAVNFLGVLSPLQDPYKNWIYFLSYWALTLLAVRAIPLIYTTPFFKIFLVLCASQALFSFVFWAHTSHRTFLDPLLAVAAGVGTSGLFASKKISSDSV